MNNHHESSAQVFGDFASIISISNQHSKSHGKRIIIKNILFKYLLILMNFFQFGKNFNMRWQKNNHQQHSFKVFGNFDG
jgi:hypothetical protein